jgi:hypothetical protein
MDDRIANALRFTEYRAALNNQIENIKFRLANKLTYSANGGTFHVSVELLGYIHSLVERKEPEVIIMDKNNTPIKITDIPAFFNAIESVYKTATIQAHNDYERLRKARKVESIVDYKIEE